MTTRSSQLGLGQYLARRRFAPSPGHPAWLDHTTRQQTIRIVHEPGETTFLYCLDPHGACRYEARFTPGTPDAVITAAIDAAFSPTPAVRAGASGARAKKSGAPE